MYELFHHLLQAQQSFCLNIEISYQTCPKQSVNKQCLQDIPLPTPHNPPHPSLAMHKPKM